MPTYLSNAGERGYAPMGTTPSSIQHRLNCRQIYEHVQGCPVCKQLFSAIHPEYHKRYNIMQKQHPPFIAQPQTNDIKISSTTAFLIIVLIIVLLIYMIRNMSR
jgi:hypothetical protein